MLSPEGIPSSSGLRAPDSIIKAPAPLALASGEYSKVIKRNVRPSVEQTPTRRSTKLMNPLRMSVHALTSIDQTPTRRPAKFANPFQEPGTKGINIPHGSSAAPTIMPEGLQSTGQYFKKSQVSQLTASWPLEVHETPSKRLLLEQSHFPPGEGPLETSNKSSRAEKVPSKTADQEHQETSIKASGATKIPPERTLQSVVPAVHTPTEELDISIYQSLGWDDVDEPS